MVDAKVSVAKILRNVIKREDMRDKYLDLLESNKENPDNADNENLLR